MYWSGFIQLKFFRAMPHHHSLMTKTSTIRKGNISFLIINIQISLPASQVTLVEFIVLKTFRPNF